MLPYVLPSVSFSIPFHVSIFLFLFLFLINLTLPLIIRNGDIRAFYLFKCLKSGCLGWSLIGEGDPSMVSPAVWLVIVLYSFCLFDCARSTINE